MTKKGNLTTNHVHLEKHEFATVYLLLNLGYDIELIPPSKINGLKMPDIIFQGKPWEMKSPIGDSKKTIENTLQTGAKQGRNIILDLRRCKRDEEQSIKEANNYLRTSKNIKRIIIITKNENLIDMKK